MTVELEQRLRARIEEVYAGHGTVREYPDELCQEAAAQLASNRVCQARLEAQVAELQQRFSDRELELLRKLEALTLERATLTSENERLREALASLKRAVAAEVIFNGAGCSGEYLKAEAAASAILRSTPKEPSP